MTMYITVKSPYFIHKPGTEKRIYADVRKKRFVSPYSGKDIKQTDPSKVQRLFNTVYKTQGKTQQELVKFFNSSKFNPKVIKNTNPNDVTAYIAEYNAVKKQYDNFARMADRFMYTHNSKYFKSNQPTQAAVLKSEKKLQESQAKLLGFLKEYQIK